MISIEYWCRYHGRFERTEEDEEACLTTEDILVERVKSRLRRSDPPGFYARLLGFFGITVKP